MCLTNKRKRKCRAKRKLHVVRNRMNGSENDADEKSQFLSKWMDGVLGLCPLGFRFYTFRIIHSTFHNAVAHAQSDKGRKCVERAREGESENTPNKFWGRFVHRTWSVSHTR